MTACSSTSRPSRSSRQTGRSCSGCPTRSCCPWAWLGSDTRSWSWRLWICSALWSAAANTFASYTFTKFNIYHLTLAAVWCDTIDCSPWATASTVKYGTTQQETGTVFKAYFKDEAAVASVPLHSANVEMDNCHQITLDTEENIQTTVIWSSCRYLSLARLTFLRVFKLFNWVFSFFSGSKLHRFDYIALK